MEVNTGDVKAIVNLTRNIDGTYSEKYNYAIGESTEPGSTFKLASLLVALEDGYIKITDSVETGNGKTKFYGIEMKDSHEGGYGTITVQKALEVSSNVGIAKIISQYYASNPSKFIEGIQNIGLHKPLGLEIPGEGQPYLKSVTDKSWSGISLPWISHGYELKLTPIQILTFYNAVANNGKMVRPRFVKEIRDKGRIIKENPVVVLNKSICSNSTLQSLKTMLEGVVEQGTAQNLKNNIYKIAGKTGTAQIANDKYGYKYDSKISYQASFVGYFPADNPKYSCIVVVNAPSNNVYYGNLVAGPIFKEAADKIYATAINIHQPINYEHKPFATNAYVKGTQEDIHTIYNQLAQVDERVEPNDSWVRAFQKDQKIQFDPVKIDQRLIPNVKGMTLKDALYILENNGLQVVFHGKGKVKNQIPEAGQAFQHGQTIVLILDI